MTLCTKGFFVKVNGVEVYFGLGENGFVDLLYFVNVCVCVNG